MQPAENLVKSEKILIASQEVIREARACVKSSKSAIAQSRIIISKRHLPPKRQVLATADALNSESSGGPKSISDDSNAKVFRSESRFDTLTPVIGFNDRLPYLVSSLVCNYAE